MRWELNRVILCGCTSMSKTKLRSAQFSINETLKQLKGYSFASIADMRHMLNRSVKDLHELGFKVAHVQGLKPKHIYALVEHWKIQNKTPATIKNYMSKLRKLSVLLDKLQLVKPSNDDYQITRRSYAPKRNKAIFHADFSKCTDPMIRMSLEAQALFGLRREESMKFIISEAWQGDYLKIKPSWTKGGIGRRIPITNENQRQWLMKVAQQVPKGYSFIPKDRTYKQNLTHIQIQTQKMGLKKYHGLRHAYAQQRYHELTKKLDPNQIGLNCRFENRASSFKPLTSSQRNIDHQAREILSRELGHSRIAITKIYIG